MSEPKRWWFVNCVDCGGQIQIAEAVDLEGNPFPPNFSWKGPCPLCGAEHTYRPNEMELSEM